METITKRAEKPSSLHLNSSIQYERRDVTIEWPRKNRVALDRIYGQTKRISTGPNLSSDLGHETASW